MREKTSDQPPVPQSNLDKVARQDGLLSLKDHAVQLIQDGILSPEEVLQIL